MSDYFVCGIDLDRPPTRRAAYSDRTAWLLAELSRLVYEPLPGSELPSDLLPRLRAAIADDADDTVLTRLLHDALAARRPASSPLDPALARAHLELVDVFTEGGTEGMIVRLPPAEGFDGMLVVVFRGTQPAIADVATDLKANMVAAPRGGRVHAGFLEAFERVREPIRQALAQHPGLPVYFAGHSLGGALALVATRYLQADSTGATYTYGCPRVADDDFFRHLKTPVYRVVHGADGVTRIPFGYGLTVLLAGIRVIPINFTFNLSEWVRRHLGGYTHHGHLIYLRPGPALAPDGKGEPRKGLVGHSPNIIWRAKEVIQRLLATGFRALASDHSMSQYALKLRVYAEYRNPRGGSS